MRNRTTGAVWDFIVGLPDAHGRTFTEAEKRLLIFFFIDRFAYKLSFKRKETDVQFCVKQGVPKAGQKAKDAVILIMHRALFSG